ncbi:MAG: molecular chaperone DnaJ [Oscillospiraceae bacterium]|nr:molecular chaperone DnaJ [Oscillospiraceae bacterium]
MKNPYEILGVPPDVNDARLREAYRRLAMENDGNPRSMAQINEAYDAILLSRGSGANARQTPPNYMNTQYGNQNDQSYQQPNNMFEEIRRRLRVGHYDDADTLLDGYPKKQRDAEWYYLKGCAQRGRGWLEEAIKCFSAAEKMEPTNQEYRAAYEAAMHNRRGAYRAQRREKDDDDCCGICTGLLCADCCCECAGGDLIPCC